MNDPAVKIIDMRLRPPFLHPFFGALPGTPEQDLVRWVNRRVGADIDASVLGGNAVRLFARVINGA